MLSKVFTKTLRNVCRIKAVRPQVAVSSSLLRAFSTEADVQRAKAKLAKSIGKEIKYEEENYQVDDSAQNFLGENGFQLKDSENDNNIELRKQVGSSTIIVTFQSRSPQFEEEPEQNEQENNQEEEEQQQQQDFCDFTVYILKNNKQSLVYECTSYDSEITVNSVNVVDDVEGHKKMTRFERSTNLYNGPDYATLDERLQTSLVEYLRGYGINEELAVFVEHMSLDKEQRLYMKWLNEINKFIEH